MVTRARVLLVEDDPLVRRFVQMALEPLDVELVPCATLAEARRAWDAAAAPVVLTDLTLPDGSGLEWLAWLQARDPSSGSTCRTVVFSGAVNAATERQLAPLQVWRVLHKPVSVGALMDCVSEALASLAPTPPAAEENPVAEEPAPDPAMEFFGGDHVLYGAYRQACLVQFPQDVAVGDRAAMEGDCASLRRVAHNLKSVLTMLGEAQAARWARSTEDHAAASATEPMVQDWQRLRELVTRLLA